MEASRSPQRSLGKGVAALVGSPDSWRREPSSINKKSGSLSACLHVSRTSSY